jgi:YHYH protein
MCLSAALVASGCGSSTASSSSASSSTTLTNQYAIAYKAASWGNTMTVGFPSSCTMTVTTTGKPNYTPNPYYLGPASTGQTVVAYTAQTNTPVALIAYANIASGLTGSSATINSCPTKASTTTATGLGAIGYLISGTAMFNPFEMNASTAAVADNASYTFVDSTGTTQTAYFLDQCDTHSNGSTWHAHGNPSCVTSQVDTATGPSHIIGIALDGFPIYGGRDINGSVITLAQLDTCNGITSATPEFPSGAYHYVLPIGVTSKYASMNCYSGTVSAGAMAAAKKLACDMKIMMAMLSNQPPIQPQNKRRDTQSSKQKMAEMMMPDGTTMPAGSM